MLSLFLISRDAKMMIRIPGRMKPTMLKAIANGAPIAPSSLTALVAWEYPSDRIAAKLIRLRKNRAAAAGPASQRQPWELNAFIPQAVDVRIMLV